MKVENINKKVSEKIYSVDVENVCDSTKGYFTTKEEAIQIAKEEKEYTPQNINVNTLIWNEEEQEYLYQYENNSLIEPVFSI